MSHFRSSYNHCLSTDLDIVGPARFLLHTHGHSPLARAMHAAIRTARVNDKFQDPLYLFLELVRAGVVHGHLWSGRAFSGGPSFGSGERFPTDHNDCRKVDRCRTSRR